jgi:hypothetical protein
MPIWSGRMPRTERLGPWSGGFWDLAPARGVHRALGRAGLEIPVTGLLTGRLQSATLLSLLGFCHSRVVRIHRSKVSPASPHLSARGGRPAIPDRAARSKGGCERGFSHSSRAAHPTWSGLAREAGLAFSMQVQRWDLRGWLTIEATRNVTNWGRLVRPFLFSVRSRRRGMEGPRGFLPEAAWLLLLEFDWRDSPGRRARSIGAGRAGCRRG